MAVIIAGAALRAPGVLAVGVVVVLTWLVRSPWTRFGLRRLTYERHLSAVRAAVGDEIGLEITVRNRKLLPLPWLQIDDLLSEEASLMDRQLELSDVPGFGALRTTWTVGWFERVTRRLTILAEKRGVYEFHSIHVRVGDLFSTDVLIADQAMPERYRVVPRSVPVRTVGNVSEMPGSARTPHGLFEDPTLFAGVRPYQPGEPLRRVHWKATARVGTPVSRRFDPGHERELMIALDAQTVRGPVWLMQYDDELFEELCTTAMSLARSLVAQGVACGLAVNGYSVRPGRSLVRLPGASPAQVAGIADDLAELRPWARARFADLLDRLGRRLPPSTTILAVTSGASDGFVPVLRRLKASGHEVRLAAMGPQGPEAVRGARSMGIDAYVARLDADWRTARALELVS